MPALGPRMLDLSNGESLSIQLHANPSSRRVEAGDPPNIRLLLPFDIPPLGSRFFFVLSLRAHTPGTWSFDLAREFYSRLTRSVSLLPAAASEIPTPFHLELSPVGRV